MLFLNQFNLSKEVISYTTLANNYIIRFLNNKNKGNTNKIMIYAINDLLKNQKNNFYLPKDKIKDNISVNSLLIFKNEKNTVETKTSNFYVIFINKK